MIDLLERFKENEIQNKDDLLYSLQSIYDNFDSDTSAPQARKELLEKETIDAQRFEELFSGKVNDEVAENVEVTDVLEASEEEKTEE